MSRVAKAPVIIPDKVEVNFSGRDIVVKGANGELKHVMHMSVEVKNGTTEDGKSCLNFKPLNGTKKANAITGTTRNIVNNMITGVTVGFTKELDIEGVGYRAQAKGKVLVLTLGYSHPVEYEIPEGVSIELPTQTSVIVKGIDKQKVGQAAAEIHAYRKPDPYKNKGVRYKGKRLIRKEVKNR